MPRDTAGLGSSPFARRYWGNRCYFLLLRVLRCFSSPRSPHASRDAGIAPGGLPHSDIPVSQGICPSAGLFAACHVLLRLREPRHPPCALVCSVISFSSTPSGDPPRILTFAFLLYAFTSISCLYRSEYVALVCSALLLLVSLASHMSCRNLSIPADMHSLP